MNPQWHLTSATPYDPPLTFGGWKQSQALGARIGSILHSREAAIDPITASRELSTAARGGDQTETDEQCRPELPRGRRRKQRLIIHTSPFLRCIETSIGISAGLEQYRGCQISKQPPSPVKPHSHNQPVKPGSPNVRPTRHRNSSNLSAISEPDEFHDETSPESGPHPRDRLKARLRIDAFLGEWLSPAYFELITPPPDSKLMVASAKADLLHLKEIEILHAPAPALSGGHFPGGWGSDRSTVDGFARSGEKELFANLTDLGQSLPKLSRSNTCGESGSPKSINARGGPPSEVRLPSDHVGYTPPQLALGISPMDGIPAGYVAHARDACLDIDYGWDSMRLPHNWGDGGVLGEEWSSMHRRFRRGLQCMIAWYQNCDTAERRAYLRGEVAGDGKTHRENEEEMETVLVLVTHGAGCNALIGTLSNQPVLLDVGMASLSMAVRKARTGIRQVSFDTTSTVTPSRRSSVADSGVCDDYEVKMIASTEHLRVPALSPRTSRVNRSSTTFLRARPPFLRHHSGSLGSNAPGPAVLDISFSIDEDPHCRPGNMPTQNFSGLWSKPMTGTGKKEDFELPSEGSVSPHEPKVTPREDDGNPGPRVKHELKDGEPFAMPYGLWGASPQARGTVREKGMKRRWTHSEPSLTH